MRIWEGQLKEREEEDDDDGDEKEDEDEEEQEEEENRKKSDFFFCKKESAKMEKKEGIDGPHWCLPRACGWSRREEKKQLKGRNEGRKEEEE